jgi:hypothetical protein
VLGDARMHRNLGAFTDRKHGDGGKRLRHRVGVDAPFILRVIPLSEPQRERTTAHVISLPVPGDLGVCIRLDVRVME